MKSLKNSELSDVVQIMPDIAVCSECISDFDNPRNRRYFYPFTNCTQCGPRYSIIYNLPYDRPRTTMNSFKMCRKCTLEYADPLNRRFHAQPNACPVCGPWPTLTSVNNANAPLLRTDSRNILEKAVKLLKNGKILAIRSIGGFLLACDARNDLVVKRLRMRKKRPAKPFAIMCKDLKTVKKLCYINREEAKILKSLVSPIVLLRKKESSADISYWIAPKNGYWGVMLPYTPLHKLLFSPALPIKQTDKLGLSDIRKGGVDSAYAMNVSRETFQSLDTLVMTSANPKNAPIVANSDEIKTKLKNIADFILDHNRPIESRCDDSIVLNYKGPVLIRRSRGYVPGPIFLKNAKLKPVLAFGSDFKSHFALGRDDKIYLSPYIGDLSSEDSIDFFFEMLEKYQRWFGIKPEIIACDEHPDYISRSIAVDYAFKHRLPIISVQHHFAHLAGVMAEYDIKSRVIGIGYDGTGYGTDGNIWGSEIMVLDYSGFERVSHLKYVPLTGGDAIITNPRLLAKTYLKPPGTYKGLLTSSMGRLFDAVSSVLGLCHYQTFEGEAPIALEAEAMKAAPLDKQKKLSKLVNNQKILPGGVDPKSILEEIMTLKKQNVGIPEIALHFHHRIIDDTLDVVKQVSKKRKIKTVCLSGGVFQNRIILNGIYSNLGRAGFKVCINRKVPINDGGIAFGQAVVAAAGLSKKSDHE